jgi:hippurate hydrolase
MAIINRIGEFHQDMTAWRRDLHEHPELGFEEHRTSAIVADKLKAFGFDEIHTGIAKTGVVGVLRAGAGSATIGLRGLSAPVRPRQ